jgi:hypothetical protein
MVELHSRLAFEEHAGDLRVILIPAVVVRHKRIGLSRLESVPPCSDVVVLIYVHDD